MTVQSGFRWLSGLVMAALLTGGATTVFAAKRVKIGMFAFGHTRMVGQHLIDDGIAKKWGAKYGVDLKISFPNDDFAAFMGKSTQVIALSSLEAARLVGDEGLDIVMWGKLNTSFQEFYVRTDSPYKSPADLKGKKIVIAGWDTGSAQIGTILMKGFWGLDLRKDFRVVTASWPVGPQVLAKGDVEMALNEMPLTLELMERGKIRPILSTYATEWAKRMGTGHLISISLWASFGKWLKKNEKAARAILGATQQAMDYINNNTRSWAGRYRNFIQDKATDSQVATFVDWWRKVQPSYKNAYLDKKFIRGETEFLKMAVEAGFIKPKGLKKSLWRVIKP
ncbi:MAG: ABC transporter substrate-binding protein [Nitrospinota bacterium]|nr:ABC transporter substrate-binding protein [Nitrospinota bacterium]